MNQLFLLKLIVDLLKENNANSLKTAQKIVDNMIKEMESLPVKAGWGRTPEEIEYNLKHNPIILDPDANQAKQELLNG